MNKTAQFQPDISRLQSEKITQSKLFQKFLSEESRPKKAAIQISPAKNDHTPPELSADSSRLYSEHSEIQGFSQHIFANSPDKQFNYQEYPLYVSFAENTNLSQLKQETEKLKQEFIQVLNEKDYEISKLKKDLESSKLDLMELEDKLRNDSEFELEKKISSLVEQNQKLLEVNRAASIEAKNRMSEIESELRVTKQRNEELLKDFLREKEKNDVLEIRITTLKERASILEATHANMQDRIVGLERELDLVHRREGYMEISPNTTRNFYEGYAQREAKNDPGWNRQDRSPLQRQSLEQKLESLMQDKQRLEKEYSKLPDVCKNLANKRRKEELELELEIIDTNIHSMKSKIRNRIRQLN